MNFSFQGFHDCCRRSRWQVKVHGASLACSHSSNHICVEDWQVKVHGASLACSHSSNHICAIFNGLLGVEGSLLTSEALAYDLALGGEQHVWPSLSVTASDSIFAASGNVPGEGSDGGGHSAAMRLAGLRRWTHTRRSAGTKKRKMSRDSRIGFGSPSFKKCYH